MPSLLLWQTKMLVIFDFIKSTHKSAVTSWWTYAAVLIWRSANCIKWQYGLLLSSSKYMTEESNYFTYFRFEFLFSTTLLFVS